MESVFLFLLLCQVFLEPLGRVVGTTKSKSLLLEVATSSQQTSRLQHLGFALGVSEWTNHFQQRLAPQKNFLEPAAPELQTLSDAIVRRD